MMKQVLLKKNYRNQHMRYICLMMALLFILGMKAQEADNEFRLDAQLVTRGELRIGGFNPDSLDAKRISHFAQGKYVLTATYKRSWLEIKLSPKFSSVWG